MKTLNRVSRDLELGKYVEMSREKNKAAVAKIHRCYQMPAKR